MKLFARDLMMRCKSYVVSKLFFLILISSSVHAQFMEGIRTSGGLQVALPVKEFKSFASFGIGLQFQAEAAISGVFSLVGTTGWTRFFGKDHGDGKTKGLNAIPFLVGGRLHVTKRLFGGVIAGAGFMTAGSSSETIFLYKSQVGYAVNTFEIILGYNASPGRQRHYDHAALACMFTF